MAMLFVIMSRALVVVLLRNSFDDADNPTSAHANTKHDAEYWACTRHSS